jgi:hypothetical protein
MVRIACAFASRFAWSRLARFELTDRLDPIVPGSGYIYAYGRKFYPSVNLGYFAAAIVGCLLPELIHMTLTRDELALAARQGKR